MPTKAVHTACSENEVLGDGYINKCFSYIIMYFHWLPVNQRITFKILLVISRLLHWTEEPARSLMYNRGFGNVPGNTLPSNF